MVWTSVKKYTSFLLSSFLLSLQRLDLSSLPTLQKERTGMVYGKKEHESLFLMGLGGVDYGPKVRNLRS